MRIIPEHQDYRTLKEIAHYEAHPERKDSPSFKAIKKQLKGKKCFIDNGRCEGGLEVHHSIIELSAAEGVDWDKVKKDYPLVSEADDIDQMLVLCSKHHRYKYTGIHNISYNIWILQKYMTEEALEDFENAISKAKENER